MVHECEVVLPEVQVRDAEGRWVATGDPIAVRGRLASRGIRDRPGTGGDAEKRLAVFRYERVEDLVVGKGALLVAAGIDPLLDGTYRVEEVVPVRGGYRLMLELDKESDGV